MRKHMALASMALLFGCSDLWTKYTVIDPNAAQDGGGTLADAATPGCTPDRAYVQNGDTFTTCCYVSDSELSGNNVYKTIRDAQQQNIANPTIIIGCPEPRELPVQTLASSTNLGEESALPIIDRNVTIEGNKCSLNALGKNRHFLVRRSGSLTLKNIKLLNGMAVSNPAASTGWPPSMADSLTSTDGACGGAVLTFGPLTLENSIITESKSVNRQKARGGAICIAGPETVSNVKLTLKNSLLYNNEASVIETTNPAEGAAAYVFNASVELVHATILKNLNTTKNNQTPRSAALQIFNRTTKQTFVATNSLVINSSAWSTNPNLSANYAFSAKCVYDSIDKLVYDDKLWDTDCNAGTVAAGYRSNIFTTIPINADWPLPSGTQNQISPGGAWDSTMRTYSDLATCGNAGIDYFGNKRPSSGCMPGAVEPRQN